MQQASLVNGKIFHFPDGAQQRARDAGMQNEVLEKPFSKSPNQWSDPITQKWAYGYDAVEEMTRAITSDFAYENWLAEEGA